MLQDISINKTSSNYLIQHSAGSGKTNSIAWLSHRLVSVHDELDKSIFDVVIVMTDRKVVDKQLRDAVTKALTTEDGDLSDEIVEEIKRNGKQDNRKRKIKWAIESLIYRNEDPTVYKVKLILSLYTSVTNDYKDYILNLIYEIENKQYISEQIF